MDMYVSPCPNHFREKMHLELFHKTLAQGDVPDYDALKALEKGIQSLGDCYIKHYGKRDMFTFDKHNDVLGIVRKIIEGLPALPETEVLEELRNAIDALEVTSEPQRIKVSDTYAQLRMPGF